jgi:hypothetical protein
MITFTIENETNNITAHESAAQAAGLENAVAFQDQAGLMEVSAEWPASRCWAEIWNSLPVVALS